MYTQQADNTVEEGGVEGWKMKKDEEEDDIVMCNLLVMLQVSLIKYEFPLVCLFF